MRRILDETTDLLRLYRHHVGKSEVPSDWQTWACISAIAACVADRVWIKKLGKPLNPALYVMLLGPSGLGKGAAIEPMLDYLEDIPMVNTYSGVVTAQKFLHFLAGPQVKKRRPEAAPDAEATLKRDPAKVFLVTEELTWCLGEGPPAMEFVRMITGMYKKSSTIKKATISSGTQIIKKAAINWLSGTTLDWLSNSLPRNAIEGGFIGRLIIVDAEYDLDTRYRDAILPPDYEEVSRHIRKRFHRLTEVSGEFRVSAKARAIEEQWYYGRPRPHDDRLIPIWKRQHDHLLKLAMVLSLSESYDLRILRRHMIAARDLIEHTFAASLKILEACYTTTETEGINLVRHILRKAGQIKHSVLQRKVSPRGIDARKLAGIIETLKNGKEIKTYTINRGGKVYEWQKTKIGGRRAA